MKKNNIDMLNGPLLGNIIKFTIPVIATGVLQLLYNTADLIVIGQFAGKTALAAVGATGSIITLIVNFFTGFSVGASVIVAQSLGAKDDEKTSKAAHTAMCMSGIFGVFVTIIGLIGCNTFLTWMGTPDNVIDLSALYMRIYFIGTPMNMIYYFSSAILRATGDTKRPLYFLSISGVVNVALNLLFVIVFKMSVAGVALATIVSQALSALLTVWCLAKLDGPCRLKISKMRMDKNLVKQIVLIGMPAGLQNSLFSFSNVIIQSTLNSFGDVAMSGSAAASNIDAYINTSENAVYQAALTFAGQNIGARQYKRTKKIMWNCVACSTVICLVLEAVVVILRHPLLSLYLPGEEEAIQYGITRIFHVTPSYVLLGLCEVYIGMLRGYGRPNVPMLISVFGICGTRLLWIFTIVQVKHTFINLFLSYPISWLVTLIALIICYIIEYKKLPEDGMELARTK